MDKLKRIWKYQCYASFLLIILVFGSVVVNQMTIKPELIAAVKHSYALTFVVANSQKTFEDITALLLALFLMKDIIITFVMTIVVTIYILIYRSIVKHLFGYIKMVIVGLLLLVLLVIVSANMYIDYQVSMLTSTMLIENIVFVLLILSMITLYVRFFIFYKRYRKEHGIALFSRASFLITAYKTIKNTVIICVVLMLFIGLGAILSARIAIYIIHQLALENYLAGSYYFNLLQLFQNPPPMLQQMLTSIEKNDWFYTIQNGVVVIDIHSIDTRIQSRLTNIVQEQTRTLLSSVVKALVIYTILSILNFIHKRKQFMNLKIAYCVGILILFKLFIFKSDFILFKICDILFLIAGFIYIIDAIDKQFFKSELADIFVSFWEKSSFKHLLFGNQQRKSKSKADRAKTKNEVDQYTPKSRKPRLPKNIRKQGAKKHAQKQSRVRVKKQVRAKKMKRNRGV